MSNDNPYDYKKMDPAKVKALLACRSTFAFAERRGYFPDHESLGESVATGILKLRPGYQTLTCPTGGVLESLGTKNLVADDYQALTGISLHDQVSVDNCMMSFNDAITLGALPYTFNQLLAVGSDKFFPDKEKDPENFEAKSLRLEKINAGTIHACSLAGVVYQGGETPVLGGNVTENGAVFAGYCQAVIREPRFKLGGSKIRHGDRIIMLRSSGVHSNGISKLREIAASLPNGYLTVLSDGRTFGESILDATMSYVNFIEDCQNENIELHYTANITGHGLPKTMRALEPFRYVIEKLHQPHPIFSFISQQLSPLGWDDKKLLNTYNWGNGFAVIAPDNEVGRIIKVAGDLGIEAIDAGYVETSNERFVYLEQLGINYDELAIR